MKKQQSTINNQECIHQLFEQQVERTPQVIAVIQEQEQISYESLNEKANQLAHYLQQQGISPEKLVGICVERSVEMVIVLLGILKAGGGYVPLDPQYPPERLEYMIRDTQMSVIVTQSYLVDKLAQNLSQDITIICIDRDWQQISQQASENPSTEVKSENLAYAIYTSGSTGQPKGVMIEHRSVVKFTESQKILWEINSGDTGKPTLRDRILQFVSISFDPLVQEIYPCLCAGATLVLRTEEMLSSFSTFIDKCRQWQLTVLCLPAAFWHSLVTELAINQSNFPESVRLVFVGGERLLPEKLNLWQEYIQKLIDKRQLSKPPQLVNCYGPTETTVMATYCELSTYNLGKSCSSVPIGNPMPHTQVYLLDEDLQPVPKGTPGELYIGGISLARGYLNRRGLTQEKFINNPLNPLDRLYKTGDLGRYLEDGKIEFLGRIDNQIKIRGFRVELGEIEAFLTQHGAIEQAIVITTEDNFGNKQLVAYIVPQLASGARKAPPIIPQLREFLQDKLPEYMIPSAFGIIDTLPLTPNGKVDRKALAALPVSDLLSAKTYIPPRTPEEELLAKLWLEVLEVGKVGIKDNFFELGGDSLKIMVLANRIHQQLGKHFSMVELFKFPTIAEFAPFLRDHEALSPPNLNSEVNPIPLQQELQNSIPTNPPSKGEIRYFPASFLQERFWTYRHLGSFYHIPNYFHLQGDLNLAILEKSCNEIIRRQEILRTKLQEINGSLVQVVVPNATINLSVIDLQNLAETEQNQEIEKLTQQKIQSSVFLDQDPWLCLTLVKLAETSHILLICLHSLIANERSTEIFLQELGVLYDAFLADKPAPLPELPLQYGDYAIAERQSLTEETLEARRDYWQQWLSREPQPLVLPTDKPIPKEQSFQAETLQTQISPEHTAKLKILSQKQQVTLFTTVTAVLGLLLHHYNPGESLVIGVPSMEGNQGQFGSLMGDFGKMWFLRLDLSKNTQFLPLLERVKQEMLSVIAYQDVPFQQIAKTFQPPIERSQRFSRVYLDFLLGTPREHLELSNLSVTSIPLKLSMARLDLGLIVWQKDTSLGTSLQLWWRYKKDLFEANTIAQIGTNFQDLLEKVINEQ